VADQEPEQLELGEGLAERGRDERRIQAGLHRIGELVAGGHQLAEQRRSGLDPVVQTGDGRVCWASELSDEEIQAASTILRPDLTAPPGREHEGPPEPEREDLVDEDGQPYPF
jgi:hypothetical protein